MNYVKLDKRNINIAGLSNRCCCTYIIVPKNHTYQENPTTVNYTENTFQPIQSNLDLLECIPSIAVMFVFVRSSKANVIENSRQYLLFVRIRSYLYALLRLINNKLLLYYYPYSLKKGVVGYPWLAFWDFAYLTNLLYFDLLEQKQIRLRKDYA